MKPLALIVALVAFSVSAFAEGVYQSVDELRLLQSISISVNDQVVDGCLRNPNALRSEAKTILQQSGIKVTDNPSEQGHRLVIAAAGQGIKLPGAQDAGLCVVRVDVDVARIIPAPEGHLAAAWAYKKGALVGGDSKTKSQENIKAAVSKLVSDLAKEASKARGQ